MNSNPVDFHGAFMLNHMMAQFVVAVFTKNFWFGAFMQLLVNFMFFNIILPPTPLPFDFLLDTNMFFVVAQLMACYVGVAVSNMLYLPELIPLIHIKKLFIGIKIPKWGLWTTIKLFFILVLPLNIIPRLLYDYGMSVFDPGMLFFLFCL